MESPDTPVSAQPIPQRLLRWGLRLLDCYAIALVVFVALRLWVTPRPMLIELLANFLEWMLLPALPILIVSCIKRQWRRAGLWSLPTIAFLMLFGGLFVPRLHPVPSGASVRLRVMTWNLLGIPQPFRQPQIAEIRACGADIVALQEVSADSAAQIARELSAVYPYQILHPAGVTGSGLLSKYPLEDRQDAPLLAGAFFCARAVVNINGTRIRVVSAHPPPPLTSMQEGYDNHGSAEIGRLTRSLTQSMPTLILGDFNMCDQSVDYPILVTAGLHDTFREVGWGLGATWPNIFRGRRFMPMVRIDYIWHSPHFTPVDCWVGPKAVSDHSPVLADLVLVR